MACRFVTVEEFQSDDFQFDDATVEALANAGVEIARERTRHIYHMARPDEEPDVQPAANERAL